MKTKMYKEELLRKRTNEMVKEITSKTCGILSKKLIKNLLDKINFEKLVWSDIPLNIEVVNDINSAADKLTLLSDILKHSWAGEHGIEKLGQILHGNATFGEQKYYQYSDNGTITHTKENYSCPNFDQNRPFVIYVKSNSWNTEESNSYDDTTHTLVIYKPKRNKNCNKKIMEVI